MSFGSAESKIKPLWDLEPHTELELLWDPVGFPELSLDLGASRSPDESEETAALNTSEENLVGVATAVPPLTERREPVSRGDGKLISRTKRPEALSLLGIREPLDLDVSRIKSDLLPTVGTRSL